MRKEEDQETQPQETEKELRSLENKGSLKEDCIILEEKIVLS